MHNLIATLFGPIFSKELIEMARRQRYYLSRVAYGMGLLFVLLMVWESNQWLLRSQGPIHGMQRVAESFATAIYGVQFAAVFIFVPLFLGGVICGEREERTLEQLFTTPLTNSQIVFGKLVSRVTGLIGLMLCGLPVLSLTFLFGGVDPGTMLRVFAATLLAILYTSAHAIYFSTVTKSALGALVRTYWWMAVWLAGVPITCALIMAMLPRGSVARLETYFLAGLAALNPLATFILTLDGFTYSRIVALTGAWIYPAMFVLPALWSFFLIWRAVRRLRADPIPFQWWLRIPFVGRVVRFFGRQSRRAYEGLTRPLNMLPRPSFASVARKRNPLWVRARQAAAYDREGYIRRIQWAGWLAALFFLILTAIVSHRKMDHADMAIAFLGPTWFAIALLTTLIAGSSLIGDRRRGFLELVLVTPLSGREIIDGTALAIWEHVRRVYWLPWALAGVFWVSGALDAGSTLCSLLTATLFLVLVVFHGIACSLAARTLAGALVATFLLPSVTLVGTAMAMGMFERGHGPLLWILCAVALPVTAIWVRRRLNAASIGCFSTVVHLSLAALLSCWTVGSGERDLPGAAMHSGYITMAVLERRGDRGFHTVPWFAVVVCYWIALSVNVFWLRRSLLRHFDRYVDRPKRLAAPQVQFREAINQGAAIPAKSI